MPVKQEQVMAVPREDLEGVFNRPFVRVAEWIMHNTLCSAFFGDRESLEHDPRYKQIIPYILIRRGSTLLCYERKGSEKRLTGLLSIGVGGHVNPGETILSAAYRELHEEVKGRLPGFLQFAGLLNEEETDVGKHHVGVVYTLDISKETKVASNESALRNLRFESVDSLYDKREQMELWSRICIEHYSNIFLNPV